MMDPLIRQINNLRKSGLTSMTLIAGILLGVYAYHSFEPLFNQAEVTRPITNRGPLRVEEQSNIRIFELAAPSVVFITTKSKGWYLRRWNVQEVPQGSGSGFIWDKRGHIVTNYHVIQGANSFEVVLNDQSSYEAKLVGVYADKDLAVLRIKAPAHALTPIPVGTTDELKVGQHVLAIGNPFGLDHTLTTGVVSALDRTLESVTQRKIDGVIQTDAAINPGNSGGPLLDSAGRLMGVNTQIYSTSGSSAGIGFAIPVDTVNEVVPQLIRYGKIYRPGLGINPHPKNARLMRYLGLKGLLINKIAPGSTAETAGLRGIRYRRNGSPVLGDIITALGDRPVESLQDLSDILDTHKVGDKVTLHLIRDNRLIQVQVTLQPVE